MVYFGEYPQTLASTEAVSNMGNTPDNQGYYTSTYDQERYKKVIASPYGSQYTFSTNDTIVDGNTYFFKVEPIQWRILHTNQNNEAFLLSELVLDFTHFDDTTNDWIVSDLRDFLNTTFKDQAFNTTEQSHIITKTVQNATTAPPTVTTTQADTSDAVFLLSYKDLITSAYRFSSSPMNLDCERRGNTSDYARSKGGIVQTYDTEFGFSFWWMRSAGGTAVNRDNPVSYVGYRGPLWYDAPYTDETIGVRPSIYVDLVSIRPNHIGDNEILFGEYPQTLASVQAVSQMGTTADQDGYYTSSYDQERYAKLVAQPRFSDYLFSNGDPILQDEVYYFKVEPILWRVLDRSVTEEFLMSEKILDTHIFDTQTEEWASSSMRTWIQQTLYPTIFTPSHQTYIVSKALDNQTTGYSSAPSFTNTVDDMFLLSYDDASNTAYGFGNFTQTIPNRLGLVTDYALAKGALASTTHLGPWWLRSNGINLFEMNTVILNNGMGEAMIEKHQEGYGVRPSIWIER